jgi:3',5'-cyclic AMP phosphodiesterase CpdA
MGRRLNILVISDLHCFTKDQLGKRNGKHPTNLPEGPKHPFTGMIQTIKEEGIVVDVIVCCGDLCDKADPGGIRYAWQFLQRTKCELNATQLYITTGNHDVDSRKENLSNSERIQTLTSLEPRYPDTDTLKSSKYWKSAYYLDWIDDVRFCVLNSSAMHALGSPHYEHGRIEPGTLKELSQDLNVNRCGKFNVLIVHHHPQKIPEYIDKVDLETIQNGAELLQNLSRVENGEWIIIHGHKHLPGISYARGGSLGAPLVLSAGSFSGDLYQVYQGRTANQFYIISIDLDSQNKYGCVGTFRSWDYSITHGWSPAVASSGLPARGGFGFRSNLVPLMDRIQRAVTTSTLSWQALCDLIPELTFLMPDDLIALSNHIHRIHSLAILFDTHTGLPMQIGHRP